MDFCKDELHSGLTGCTSALEPSMLLDRSLCFLFAFGRNGVVTSDNVIEVNEISIS